MDRQEDLTNESVKKKFKSQFELVGYAIKLAENMIKTGRGPRLKSDSQNVAINIMEEISAGVDKFEDIPKEVKSYDEEPQAKTAEKRESGRAEGGLKTSERKRTRKILMD